MIMKLISMTDFVLEQKLRVLDGFENYLISEYGIIIRVPYKDSLGKIREGKILSIKTDINGYMSCVLRKNNKSTFHLIHRLVAKTFIGDSVLQVNHKDCNKSNNHYSNLEYTTDKQNKEHSVLNNLNAKGSRNGRSKLTEENVIEIKKLLKDENRTLKSIGELFNVTYYTISDIKRGKIWKHVF